MFHEMSQDMQSCMRVHARQTEMTNDMKKRQYKAQFPTGCTTHCNKLNSITY